MNIQNNSRWSCNASFDFINISLMPGQFSQIQELEKKLSTLSLTSPLIKHTTHEYNLITTYNINNGSKINLLKSNSPCLPTILVLRHPDISLFNLINNYLNNLSYLISKIEVSLDFHNSCPDKINQLYQAFKSTLYLKWVGDDLDVDYDTTTYLNNIRKAQGKGVRIYIKKENMNTFTRTEIVYKRKLLKQFNLNSLTDLININPEILTKYLEFKIFDYRIFRIRYLRRNEQNQDLERAVEEIKDMIERKDIIHADRYAKKLLNDQSCLKIHPRNEELKKFLNSMVVNLNI